MALVEAKEICCERLRDGRPLPVLDQVSFSLEKGELVCLLGASGAGKTTLAECLLALHPLKQGSVHIMGLDLLEEEARAALRHRCGLIFEDPEEQLLSPIVQDDIAFCARLAGAKKEQLPQIVSELLSFVGLAHCPRRPHALLSEGEKRRLALASVLVTDPALLLFDGLGSGEQPAEQTRMRRLIRKLHQQGKTILILTNDVQEAATADRVLVLKKGKLIAQGDPRSILGNVSLLEEAGLDIPFSVQVYHDLIGSGAGLERCPLDMKELVDDLCR